VPWPQPSTTPRRANVNRPGASADYWEPFESHFKSNPHRTDDPFLNRLRREVTSGSTLLDVAGGAGRFKLPPALSCQQATVVEPSEAMARWLGEGAREIGIANLSVIQGSWEYANLNTHDIVLSAFVLHEIVETEPIVRKLASRAGRRVLVLEHMQAPDLVVAPFWDTVHGEELVEMT